MKGVTEGGREPLPRLFTWLRLAVARVVFVAAWWTLYLTVRVCLRPEHPMRVYVTGAKHTALKEYLEALSHATAPRMSRRARRRFKRGVLTGLLLLCGFVGVGGDI